MEYSSAISVKKVCKQKGIVDTRRGMMEQKVTNRMHYNQVKQLHIENQEKEIIIREAYGCVKDKSEFLLDPLWIELAEIVAKCHYNKSKNPRMQKLSKVHVDEMVEAIGSESFKMVWRTKQYAQQSGLSRTRPLKKNYVQIVPPKQRVMFQEYRDYLLCRQGVGSKMSYKPTLSRSLKELGFLVAKSRLIQVQPITSGDFIRSLTTMIQVEGSSKLQSFWREKLTIPTIQKYGLCHAIPPDLRDLFRDFYMEVMKRIRIQVEGYPDNIPRIAEISSLESQNDEKGSVKVNDKVLFMPHQSPACSQKLVFMPVEKCMSCHRRHQDQNGPLITEIRFGNVDTTNLVPTQDELLHSKIKFSLSSEMTVLAKLLLQCHVTTLSRQVCHHCLTHHIASCHCQALKDQWRGMKTLPRFQRDGYWTVIPSSQRESFQAYMKYLLALQKHCPLQDSLMNCVLYPVVTNILI
jgi:hypothetical protein